MKPPADLEHTALNIDIRLTEVWGMLFERGGIKSLNDDFLGWLFRLAYIQGYWDALQEKTRGELLTELNYPIPPRHT